MRRVAVIGLDCVPPALLFERWRHRLPTLSALIDAGVWGPLQSCHPPITVPAWASMLTGRDPGELGLYGFRNRRSHDYGDVVMATSRSVKAPRVWDHLGQAGLRSILVGVPQTYPPPVIHGELLSCFLTPSGATTSSHPPALRGEIDALCGTYQFDVGEFRDADRVSLLQRIYAKTRQDFAVSRHLVTSRDWDFFMMVAMGPDRLHHGFWPPTDGTAAEIESGWETLREYYEFLDAEVAALLADLGDDAVVLVVSDHGAKAMQGGLCLNEWLIDQGLLVLRDRPTTPTALRPEMVDWSRTTAWGDGGYCGRVYLNVLGREPQGRVAPADYERVRSDIIAGLAAVEDGAGVCLHSAAHRPQDLYASVQGIAPDLIAYFGDLEWRALGSVGHSGIHSRANDTGPDGANHDWLGVFILMDPNAAGGRDPLVAGGIGPVSGLGLMDIAPTILAYYAGSGIDAAAGLRGRAVDPREWRDGVVRNVGGSRLGATEN